MSESTHWLYRHERWRKSWILPVALLVVAIIPEFFVHHHGYFAAQGIHLDTSFGFYIGFSLISCAVMVGFAKLLSSLLKRNDSYYTDND